MQRIWLEEEKRFQTILFPRFHRHSSPINCSHSFVFIRSALWESPHIVLTVPLEKIKIDCLLINLRPLNCLITVICSSMRKQTRTGKYGVSCFIHRTKRRGFQRTCTSIALASYSTSFTSMSDNVALSKRLWIPGPVNEVSLLDG